jgi:hypothetical protein
MRKPQEYNKDSLIECIDCEISIFTFITEYLKPVFHWNLISTVWLSFKKWPQLWIQIITSKIDNSQTSYKIQYNNGWIDKVFSQITYTEFRFNIKILSI